VKINLSAENKAMLASYGRSIVGAAVAVYVSTGDPKAALNALWAAALPVAIRYFNPKDTAFGKVAK
jgi:hypothetical protein